MAVREALLTLLTAGPAYGFQLHGALAQRTGGRRQVNVGQTYATLERLTKQRLVEPGGTTEDGLPLHRLTADGEAAAAAWLDGTDGAGADPWDETVDRVLIGCSLAGVDRARLLDGERARWAARAAAASVPTASEAPDDPTAMLRALALAATAERARAALAWLDAAAAAAPPSFETAAERPRRGRRPSKAAAQPDAQSPVSP